MTNLKQGDKIYLFYHLPIDATVFTKLPITLAPGIQLIVTPSLENAAGSHNQQENIALAGYVYPGYGLPGFGVCKFAIKVDAHPKVSDKEMNHLLWTTLLGFILIKPLFIHIMGTYIYGENGFKKGRCGRFDLRSNLCLEILKNNQNTKYTEDDIIQISNIIPKINNILSCPNKYPRQYYNLNTFMALAITEKLCQEGTIFSRLFTVLDSFTGNTGHKHNTRVATRIAKFIIDKASNQPIAENVLQKYLQDQWEIHRTPDIHGHLKATIPDQAQPEIMSINNHFTQDLFNIFEITRFALLKMLLLPDNDFNSYSKIPLQKFAQQDQDQSLRDQAAETFFATTYPNEPSMKWFVTI